MLCASNYAFNYFKISLPVIYSLSSNFSKSCLNHCTSRNPYEVLGLKNTCSTKDVKKAYIRLCKELHPDRKPEDLGQHKKFVELNNAYSILINEISRRDYDNSAKNPQVDPYHIFRGYQHTQKRNQSNSNPFEKTTAAEEEEEEEAFYESKAYKEQEEYFKQQQRNSHLNFARNQSMILIGCFFLMVGGFIMYYSAYSYAKNYTLKKVDERSRRISKTYRALRQDTEDINREEQLSKLKRKWRDLD